MPSTKRSLDIRKHVRPSRMRLREAQRAAVSPEGDQGQLERAQQNFLRATFLAKKGRLPKKT